jgi:hypothetical protein
MYLLIRLGYTCYFERSEKFALGESMVIAPESVFCGDFYCRRQPLWAVISANSSS